MYIDVLRDAAIVLGVAGVTSAVTSWLRIPSIIGFLLAGFMVGPYIPIPLFADPERVKSISQFSVLFVMFSIGLEVKFSHLLKALPKSGVAALVEFGLMFFTGMGFANLFGWSGKVQVFVGAAMAISSSTIIVSKLLEDRKPDREVESHLRGILVVQDILSIIIITLLSTFALGADNQESIFTSVGSLLGLLSLVIFVGMFFIPRFIRRVAKDSEDEVLFISALGLCFVFALYFEFLGYSLALGGFLAGVFISESGVGPRVAKLNLSLKNVFVAIFFVSVGMSVDPVLAFHILPQALLIAFSVCLMQLLSVSLGSLVSGIGFHKALFTGLALGQIGEFSFIVIALGRSMDVVSNSVETTIVTAGVITAFVSPFVWRRSSEIVLGIDRIVPSKIKRALGIYELWYQKLVKIVAVEGDKLFSLDRRLLFLIIDTALILALPYLVFSNIDKAINLFSLNHLLPYKLILSLSLLGFLLLPLFYGIIKILSFYAYGLADKLFSVESLLSSSERSRQLFSFVFKSIFFLLLSFPLFLLMSFYVEVHYLGVFLLAISVLLIVRFYKEAGSISLPQETGGMKLISAFKKQSFQSQYEVEEHLLELPGIGSVEQCIVKNQNFIGCSIGQLDIRNRWGVSVVAIARSGAIQYFPGIASVLEEEDLLYVLGKVDGISEFKDLVSSNKQIEIAKPSTEED